MRKVIEEVIFSNESSYDIYTHTGVNQGIINDIKDVDKDRKHEVKKNRPIASGKVSVKSAVIIAVIMFALMCIINTFINGSVFNYGIIYLLCYFLLNIF